MTVVPLERPGDGIAHPVEGMRAFRGQRTPQGTGR
jgi:hypothetical protein